MKYLVAGNYARFAVTLTQKSGELITPYIPTEGDVVQISLYGARRFDYPNFEQASNVLTFEDNGCLQVGLYCLEVKITEANTHKLRCMYREQIRVVASNDDIPTDASFSDDDVQLSGQFDIVASTEIVVDDELSLTSTNPVQNKVVTAAINDKADEIDVYEDSEDGVYVYRVDLLSHFGEETTTISSSILPYATQENGGIMSAADKTKLDGIEAGANKTIVDSALSTASENPVQNKAVMTALNAKYDNVSVSLDSSGLDITFKANGVNAYELYIGGATSTTAGLFLPSEKTKLDALPTNSDLQTALNAKGDTLESVNSLFGVQFNLKRGDVVLASAPLPFACFSQGRGGLMTGQDYAKLAALPTNSDLTTALNGKQATLTWDTVPTQNSTNPVTSGGLYSTFLGKEDKVAIEAPVNTTDATLPITALNTDTGKYYRIDVAVETLAITLPAMTDSTKIANVVLYLTGGTTPAVTIASTAPSGGTAPDVYYQDGFAIEAGKTYEVNCLWNGAAWVVAAVEIVIS